MTVIWKYTLPDVEVTFDIPAGSTLLDVHTQDGAPCLWFEVNLKVPPAPRRFVLIGTGHEPPGHGHAYRGTCHDVAGLGLVMHVYEDVRAISAGIA